MTSKEYQQKYREVYREKIRAYQIAYTKRLQIELFSAYGNKCQCCGESNLAFLSIDHVNNDGKQDRWRNGKRVNNIVIFKELKQEGWPERIQLLCFNCNCARKNNDGICPHKEIVSLGAKMLLGVISCDEQLRRGKKVTTFLRTKSRGRTRDALSDQPPKVKDALD